MDGLHNDDVTDIKERKRNLSKNGYLIKVMINIEIKMNVLSLAMQIILLDKKWIVHFI